MTKPINARRNARFARRPKAHTKHYSCVVPVVLVDVINQFLEREGHGPDNLSVPLYSNQTGNLTHYGCSSAMNVLQYVTLRRRFPPDAEATTETFEEILERKGLHKAPDPP